MSAPEEEPAANPDVQKAVEKETQHHEISKEQLLTSREPSSSIGNSSMGMRRFDSLDIESCKFPAHLFKVNWRVVFHLAFQSIGIVFGDIGTSPLYVFPSTFAENRIKHSDDILGVLSLIIYTLTLLPLFKYVFILLHATDNGDGGSTALYSLICRYAKVGLIPSQQPEDVHVSNFKIDVPSNRVLRASVLKSKLEESNFAKYFLLFATMLGTSMVIGDGILTPCISVLSAVRGIKTKSHHMNEDAVVWVSVGILICLFMVQRLGTDKVGFAFAPIICIWFASISSIGVYNFLKHDPTVFKALNPQYIVDYFRRNKKDAWKSLGGIILAASALIIAYAGQAAFLTEHPHSVENTFFDSIPDPCFLPVFVVAVLAAIIASQAMISATFSTIQHSVALGCFPRVKIIHTSANFAGQVFVPEVNNMLMLACIAVTLGFRNTGKIGDAYAIAVVTVMVLSSGFLVMIMILIWKTNILLIASYIIVIGTIEVVYFSSVLYKFNQGGYLPLFFSLFLVGIMYVWSNVYRKKYHHELRHKISPGKIKEIIEDTSFSRLPGLAIFYSDLVHGIPPIFRHYASNVPVLHSVLVFVSIKSISISRVSAEERFLFRHVEPRSLLVYRCIVRYGYNDVQNDEHELFETILLERLCDFIREDFWATNLVGQDQPAPENTESLDEDDNTKEKRNPGTNVTEKKEEIDREIESLNKAIQAGVIHLVGESEVVAGKGSGIVKKFMIDYVYGFLRRNLTRSERVFEIPHKRMLKVGMTYEL
uniref:Potassium transporter n=1 Tax=Kalanchoe fedtschenkoi TaxID=63787 RepID=A0A7N0TTH4_KALFE